VVADDDSSDGSGPDKPNKAIIDERHSPLKLYRPPERTLTGERLRRAQRLRSPRDFERVRRHGRRASGTLLLLGYLAQAGSDASSDVSNAGFTRIGLSVSRRVGGAVARNRVKRRLREVVRRLLAEVTPGYDLVLTARPGAADAPIETLRQEVRALITRARLLKVETDRGMVP
jgi:ribonuclease P protein component